MAGRRQPNPFLICLISFLLHERVRGGPYMDNGSLPIESPGSTFDSAVGYEEEVFVRGLKARYNLAEDEDANHIFMKANGGSSEINHTRLHSLGQEIPIRDRGSKFVLAYKNGWEHVRQTCCLLSSILLNFIYCQ